MATILEEIQTRLTEAQKHLTETTQAFQLAQQAQQRAQVDFNVWSAALQIEQREEQLRQTAATEDQRELPLSTTKSATLPPIATEPSGDTADVPNKTDVVRNLLKQHPTGMTAIDIWKEVGAEFNHRPYLYSVLKRLRDRGEIVKRRSKYYLLATPKAAEVKEQTVVH